MEKRISYLHITLLPIIFVGLISSLNAMKHPSSTEMTITKPSPKVIVVKSKDKENKEAQTDHKVIEIKDSENSEYTSYTWKPAAALSITCRVFKDSQKFHRILLGITSGKLSDRAYAAITPMIVTVNNESKDAIQIADIFDTFCEEDTFYNKAEFVEKFCSPLLLSDRCSRCPKISRAKTGFWVDLSASLSFLLLGIFVLLLTNDDICQQLDDHCDSPPTAKIVLGCLFLLAGVVVGFGVIKYGYPDVQKVNLQHALVAAIEKTPTSVAPGTTAQLVLFLQNNKLDTFEEWAQAISRGDLSVD